MVVAIRNGYNYDKNTRSKFREIVIKSEFSHGDESLTSGRGVVFGENVMQVHAIIAELISWDICITYKRVEPNSNK